MFQAIFSGCNRDRVEFLANIFFQRKVFLFANCSTMKICCPTLPHLDGSHECQEEVGRQSFHRRAVALEQMLQDTEIQAR